MNDYEAHEIALIGLFFIFFVINIIDVFSTLVGLSNGLIELNWLAVMLMQKIGILPALVLLKAFFLAIIGATTWAVLRVDPSDFLDDNFMIGGLLLLNVFGFFVLSNNLSYLGLWPHYLPVYHFKAFF